MDPGFSDTPKFKSSLIYPPKNFHENMHDFRSLPIFSLTQAASMGDHHASCVQPTPCFYGVDGPVSRHGPVHLSHLLRAPRDTCIVRPVTAVKVVASVTATCYLVARGQSLLCLQSSAEHIALCRSTSIAANAVNGLRFAAWSKI